MSVRNGEGTLKHMPPKETYKVNKCKCGKNKFSYQKVCGECKFKKL